MPYPFQTSMKQLKTATKSVKIPLNSARATILSESKPAAFEIPNTVVEVSEDVLDIPSFIIRLALQVAKGKEGAYFHGL